MSQSAFLFVEGMPDSFTQALPRQLDTVNRIGTHSGQLTCTWQVASTREDADAFCLGEEYTGTDIAQLERPIITHLSGLHGQVVKVAFPLTAMAFVRALQEVETLLHIESDRVVTAVSSIDDVLSDAMPSQAASEQVSTSAALPFFTCYLQDFTEQQQKHVLTWAQDVVWIDRTLGKVYTRYQNMAELVALLADTAVPQVVAYYEPPADAVVFTYEALIWSYGLHAPISEDVLARLSVSGSLFQLKKWPLFGQWETNAKLLLLTTLFTQKPISITEAAAKSGLSTEKVLHFLVALTMVHLPLEHKLGDENHYGVDIAAKKDVVWINRLREKLHMQEILSD